MTVFEAATGPGETPPADAVAPRDSTAQAPTSVARLNATIRDFVARWNTVWVEGEITSWNVRAGNVFARLKDTRSDAQISIRVWSSVRGRIPADLGVGDHVVAAVKADYFVRSGDFSFAVSAMKHVGLGDQLERLERLRVQLRQEGLFDPARKKRLPFLPTSSASSPASAPTPRRTCTATPSCAGRRYGSRPRTPPCRGTAACRTPWPRWPVSTPTPRSTSSSSRAAAATRRPSSASATSAWSAPSRRPPRRWSAPSAMRTTIPLDDVADLRASTPTDAAKRVVPDVGEQRALIAQLRSRATTRLTQRLSHDIAQLEQLRSRPVLRSPLRSSTRARRRPSCSSPVAATRSPGSSTTPAAGRASCAPRCAPCPRRHPGPRLRDRTPRGRCHPPRCSRCARGQCADAHGGPRVVGGALGGRDRGGRLSGRRPRHDVGWRSERRERHPVDTLSFEAARDELVRVVAELEQGHRPSSTRSHSGSAARPWPPVARSGCSARSAGSRPLAPPPPTRATRHEQGPRDQRRPRSAGDT